MREVLKWNKNHLTGELVEKKVFKPDNGVMGKVKIELFRDGELINETFTENIIPKNHIPDCEWYRVLYRSIMYGGSNTMYGGHNQGATFHNIVLSSNNRDEDENMLTYPGGDIGWCPRTSTDAGSDTKRGTYNPTESYTEYKNGFYHAHLVYDFTTSQANGTFNSVWWSKQNYRNVILPTFNLALVENMGLSLNRHYAIYPGAFNTYFYHDSDKKFDSTTSYYYLMKNGEYYFNGAEPLTVNQKVKFTNYEYIPRDLQHWGADKAVGIQNIVKNQGVATSDLVVYNNKFEVIKRVAFNYYDLEGMSSALRKHSYTRFGPNRIFKVLDNGDVYIIFYAESTSTSSSSYRFVPSYDSTADTMTQNNAYNGFFLGIYNIDREEWVLEPSINDIRSVRANGYSGIRDIIGYITVDGVEYGYKNAKDFLFKVDPHSTREYYWTMSYHYRDSMYQEYLGSYMKWGPTTHIHGTNVLYNYRGTTSTDSDYRSQGTFLRFVPSYTAHTKLPNPVTKTSVDTMKIQYDYYIQIPRVTSPDGDYLTYPELEE